MQGPKPKSPTRKGILDRDEASWETSYRIWLVEPSVRPP
jgi:hypothetical protein